MTRQRSRSILLKFSLVFAAILAVAPTSALAGSLLSGYGGPGGGTQVLLGSTLIGAHPPGSGGGSSGGSSTGEGPQAPGGESAAGGVGAAASGGKGAVAPAKGAPGQRSHEAQGTKGHPGTSAEGSAAYTSSRAPRPVAGIVAARDSSPLGLTGTDVLLLAFLLGVLAITLGLTRSLARMQHNI